MFLHSAVVLNVHAFNTVNEGADGRTQDTTQGKTLLQRAQQQDRQTFGSTVTLGQQQTNRPTADQRTNRP